MNIKLLKDNWRKYYKRGFLTGIMVLSFMCFIDQTLTLKSPLLFIKINSFNILLYNLSVIFFGAVFCGILSTIILVIMSLVTTFKN